MSLKRTDTGEAATPLLQLQEMNEEKKADLENALLKEALAISNERCNDLIDRQNTLVEDLTTQVKNIRQSNALLRIEFADKTDEAIKEVKEIAESERTFKTQASREIAAAIRRTADEVTFYAKGQMDKSTQEVKKELAECAKELNKQRSEMKEQGLFRKIFFWATPVLLLVQTVILAFLLIT